MDEFSFDKFNTEDLKQKQEVELIKNTTTANPSSSKEDPKKINFLDIDESVLDNNQYQQNYSQPPAPQQQPISLPYDMSNSNSYLSLVLSPNLKELELMIRGLEYVKMYNPNTNREEIVLRKIAGHPLNEYGINQILTHIKIYASPEIKLGRKKQRDYYLSIQQVGKTITRLIYKNLKNFGMDTQEKQRNAKAFSLAIVELIDAAYSRSIEGRENDLSRATEMKIEGSLDSFNNPARVFSNPQQRDQLKN
jgi:hypothetical protein